MELEELKEVKSWRVEAMRKDGKRFKPRYFATEQIAEDAVTEMLNTKEYVFVDVYNWLAN